MKIGIMHPYFFPYLGYWQLMNAVDRYVIYDDVNYIKGGRVNRNTILTNGEAHNINLPLIGASPNKHINEVQVNNNPLLQQKLIKTLEMCYKKAPYYNDIISLLSEIMSQETDNLAEYLIFQIKKIADYLKMSTEFIISSKMDKDSSLKAHDKVIHICKLLGASEYYNSITGVPLYEPHRDMFEAAGIELCFPKMREVSYKQYKNDFVPNLSIIDVMMFNSREECIRLLSEFDFVGKEERASILNEKGLLQEVIND